MTALLPAPRPGPQSRAPDPARTLETLTTVVLIVLVVGVLYFAREILVPIAIAVLLSFVLSPPVKVLRDTGFGKTVAVATVVFLGFAIAVGLGFILGRGRLCQGIVVRRVEGQGEAGESA